ncbi:glycoside hydrolase family 3 protein [Leifsonia poae]|uniref:glycoside hydrolase family 3 protein n=1 Tax=Leifsonia poae TaxID=110933 RepID=UPI001CBC2505|nr:glycoside hydrolase family 3 N-terminal domain-containing protein [Leifsonia poae]
MTIERLLYRDPAQSADARAADLLGRMDLEAKAGQMFQPMAEMGDPDAPGMFGGASLREMLSANITHFNILQGPTARETAEWINALQREALARPLGIPITISSDPRHAFTDNPAAALMAGPFSQWPESLGFGAVGSEDLIRRFADTVRREYLAVGIRVALHPQIDLATEPRWARASGTFGEDVEIVSRLGGAYIEALQNGEVGAESVSVMAKHFPGGGPQKDGEDPHFAYGREQIYPGGRFDLHLEPFRAAIDAGVAQIMPYYGMPLGTEWEEVGFGFNRGIITGLLREQLGFDGIVCTDWGILSGMAWGVEDLSFDERMIKALDAGVDQFGGESAASTLVRLVRDGAIPESRLDGSVLRLLREKFRLGLFDAPLVDVEQADRLVGTPDAREAGIAAQAAAVTLLRAGEEAAALPLAPGTRVFLDGMSPDALQRRGLVAADLDTADVAIVRIAAPWEQRGDGTTWESFFHAGSLDFPVGTIERIRAIAERVPVVLDVYLDRPAILTDLVDVASSTIVNFGAADEAIARVLTGEAEPSGRLPFDLPSSMEAVLANRADVPFDTIDPLFRHGFGLGAGFSA